MRTQTSTLTQNVRANGDRKDTPLLMGRIRTVRALPNDPLDSMAELQDGVVLTVRTTPAAHHQRASGTVVEKARGKTLWEPSLCKQTLYLLPCRLCRRAISLLYPAW